MAGSSFVLFLDDPRCRNVNLSGGKGASIATMMQEGLPVPPGFVVTSAAFAAAIDRERLRTHCLARDIIGARKIIATAKPPMPVVADHYATLGGLVAVRSSACAEDSKGASYAGQQETYLDVAGLPAVLDKIIACWLSFFSDRAIFYRAEKGSLEDIDIAVVVQQMIASTKSGVLFTVDPVNGRKDRMVVEAGIGLGENVVNGENTPDYYSLDLKGAIKRSRIVDKPVLDEVELKQLMVLGQQLETLYECPQDVEWAFDNGGNLFVLQSRPITTI
jgi:pyruvate, water dikinase